MDVYQVTEQQADAAGDVLARAMFDDPTAVFIVPDLDERLPIHRDLFAELVRAAASTGLVDACGEPMAGVALWIRHGSIDDPPEPAGPRSPAMDAALERLGADGRARAGALNACLAELRRQVAPEPHLYLNLLGVTPDRHGEGVGSRLLDAGHARADREGLATALDTLTDSNVAFYERRGYRTVTSATIAGSTLRVVAMRREPRPGSGMKDASMGVARPR